MAGASSSKVHVNLSGAPRPPPSYKVVLCGLGSVGKSSLVLQLTEKKFDTVVPPTLGRDQRNITLPNGVPLTICDVAGQMEAAANNAQNFRGAHGVLVVASLDNEASFEAITRWLREIRKLWKMSHRIEMPPETPEGRREPMPVTTYLVFNKLDIAEKSGLFTQDYERHCKSLVEAYGCHGCYFTTATRYESVVAMFNSVADNIAKAMALPPENQQQLEQKEGGKKGCCDGGSEKRKDAPRTQRQSGQAAPRA